MSTIIDLDFEKEEFIINHNNKVDKIYINKIFFDDLKKYLGISNNKTKISIDNKSIHENLKHLGIPYSVIHNGIDLYVAKNYYKKISFLLCAYKQNDTIIHDPKNRVWSYLIKNEEIIHNQNQYKIDFEVRSLLKWTKIPENHCKITKIVQESNMPHNVCWLNHLAKRYYLTKKTFNPIVYNSKEYIIIHSALFHKDNPVYAIFTKNKENDILPYTFTALYSNSSDIIFDNSVSFADLVYKNKSNLPEMFTPQLINNLNQNSEIIISKHAIQRLFERCPNATIIKKFNEENSTDIKTIFQEYYNLLDEWHEIENSHASKKEMSIYLKMKDRRKKNFEFRKFLLEHIKESIKNNKRYPIIYFDNISDDNKTIDSELIDCGIFECAITKDDDKKNRFIIRTIYNKDMAKQQKFHFPTP